MKYELIKNYNDDDFKRATGIPRELFELLSEVLAFAFKEEHEKGGRKPKLTIENILVLYLTYYRDYNTFFALGTIFGIDESNAYRWIKWCESIIAQVFEDSIKNMIDMSEMKPTEEYLVDVTECSIQRSKIYEVQREYYSGKKKKHTIKIQIIISEETNKIVGVAFEKGSIHDFKLFKETTKQFDEKTPFVADGGYLGIENIFKNSIIPKKKSKNKPLTQENKDLNKLISNIRILIEHVNCQVKIFRILAERYRSRTNTFCLRALIIFCFYNFCL